MGGIFKHSLKNTEMKARVIGVKSSMEKLLLLAWLVSVVDNLSFKYMMLQNKQSDDEFDVLWKYALYCKPEDVDPPI